MTRNAPRPPEGTAGGREGGRGERPDPGTTVPGGSDRNRQAPRWPRDDFLDALWESDLPAAERVVAYVYARFAGRGEVAWVAPDELVRRSGLKRTAARAARRSLVARGWLLLVEPARQHRADGYRLMRPQGVGIRPPDGAQGVARRPPGGAQGVGFRPPRGSESDPKRSEEYSEEQQQADELLRDHFDAMDRRPPRQVVGQWQRQVLALLADDRDADDVAEALARCRERGGRPGLLPHLVGDVERERDLPPRRPSVEAWR